MGAMQHPTAAFAELQMKYDAHAETKLNLLLEDAEKYQNHNQLVSEVLREIYQEMTRHPEDPFPEEISEAELSEPEAAARREYFNQKYQAVQEVYQTYLEGNDKNEFGGLLNALPENLSSLSKDDFQPLVSQLTDLKERNQNRLQHLQISIQAQIHYTEAVINVTRKAVESHIDHSKYICRKSGN